VSGLAAGAVAVAVGAGALPSLAADATSTASTAAAAKGLSLLSVTPSNGTQGIDGTQPVITVRFSAPLASGTSTPTLKPSVKGHWKVQGATETFTPSAPIAPWTRVTVSVPKGVHATNGARLARTVTTTFATRGPSTLRVQQLLAQLGYLPVTWSGKKVSGTAAENAAAYNPPAGMFTWHGSYPRQLKALWHAGSSGVLMRGAVMAFESANHQGMDGAVGPRVWSALLSAVAHHRKSPYGYNYVLVNKHRPENMTVWHNGKVVLRTKVNTAQYETQTWNGDWPVYLRYASQWMTGKNPDGSRYRDYVKYVAYFNGGEAIHWFNRPGYGYPQSLGCVELPLKAAKRAFAYTTYGTLVHVEGPNSPTA
jgi:peptidoglycan hydrolase-like protein with peptidoglycan-binding domain